MKVKLRRNWFAPNKRRYRSHIFDGAVVVPDEFRDRLPSDAEVVEEPEAAEPKSEGGGEPKSEGGGEPKSEAAELKTFSEMAERDAADLDPQAAFRRQLEEQDGGKNIAPDVDGAAHAAQSAAAKQGGSRMRKKSGGK